MSLSPTQKLVAPAVERVLKTADEAVTITLKQKKANLTHLTRAKDKLYDCIRELQTIGTDKAVVLIGKINGILTDISKVR